MEQNAASTNGLADNIDPPDENDNPRHPRNAARSLTSTSPRNARGRGRYVGHSEGEEEEWRSIREPIMELLTRSSSALDRRASESGGLYNGRRRPGADDPPQHAWDGGGDKDDASGLYSSCSSKHGDNASKELSGARPSFGGAAEGADSSGAAIGVPSFRRPPQNGAPSNGRVGRYCSPRNGDMHNHPKGGFPKKDKDSDLEALGGYGDVDRNRVKFADQIFGGRQVKSSVGLLNQQLRQQQQHQQQQQQQQKSSRNNVNPYGGGSVNIMPSKTPVVGDTSSYNIMASLNRQQRHSNYVKKNAVLLLAIVSAIVMAFVTSTFRDSGFAENDAAATREQRQISTASTEGIMDIVNDIPLKSMAGRGQPSPEDWNKGIPSQLRGYYSRMMGGGGWSAPEAKAQQQQHQIEIQNEMIQIQNDIMNAQTKTIISGGDDVDGVFAMGQRAEEAEKRRAEEEKAYRMAMEKQEQEERKAEEEEEAAAAAAAKEAEAEKMQEARLQDLQQQQAPEEPVENPAEDPSPETAAGEELGEGDPPPLSEVELELARKETKAMLEASRRKAAEEEEQRVAREQAVVTQQGPEQQQPTQDQEEEETSGKDIEPPRAETQANGGR